MTSTRHIEHKLETLFAKLSPEKRSIIPLLSAAFHDVHTQHSFTPLFDLIEVVSPTTTIHSKGVALVAKALGKTLGLCTDDTTRLSLSGMLHDIGKIAVPDHILNKAGALARSETEEMRTHVVKTIDILGAVPGFDGKLFRWCAFHHERLGGTGYPFGLDKEVLDQGSRIMSIADVFVALTEDRIYRSGMHPKDAVAVIEQLVDRGELDAAVLDTLKSDVSRYNNIRLIAQQLENSKFQAA